MTSGSAGPSSTKETIGPCRSTSRTPGRPSNALGGGAAENDTSIRPARADAEALDAIDDHEAALANDGHTICHSLHLGQGVGGEEYACDPLPVASPQQVGELLLHQRVEARRGLVEHDKLGPMHERLHNAHLLPVAAGERPDRPVEVEGEAIREPLCLCQVDETTK